MMQVLGPGGTADSILARGSEAQHALDLANRTTPLFSLSGAGQLFVTLLVRPLMALVRGD